MKLGCKRAFTERGSDFVRDFVVDGNFIAGGQDESRWTEGTSPANQINASRGVSPTPRHWSDGQSGRIAVSSGETTQLGCETRDVVVFDLDGRSGFWGLFLN